MQKPSIQPAAFEYDLPRDEEKLQLDAMTMGYLGAIRNPSLAGDKVEQEARRKAHILKEYSLAEALTNDFTHLLSIFTVSYMAMYATRQTYYQAHADKLQADQATLKRLGGQKAFWVMRDDIKRNAKVTTLEVQ